MSVAPAGTTLTLSVPARSEQISIVRSFAYAIGRHQRLDEETIEDLKLALSELAAGGIQGGGSTILVTVQTDAAPMSVSVEVEVAGAGPSPVDPDVDRAQVVRALFPTVRIDHRPDAVVTTFSLEQA
jgi:anti-sigma regulatory factor (Ser/Thr protein kinase)